MFHHCDTGGRRRGSYNTITYWFPLLQWYKGNSPEPTLTSTTNLQLKNHWCKMGKEDVKQLRYWLREAKENRSITYYTFGKWSSLECCQTQVSYFHRSSWSSNKNIVTFQVSVNYWWSSCVQEKKTLQDLPTPAPQDFRFHHFKSLQIPRAQHTHKWE